MLHFATRTAVIALAAALIGSGIGSGQVARASEVGPGKPAPDFVGKDTQGRDVTLSSFKGKTVVLEWTNEGCPYVRKHYGSGNMQALQAAAASQGIVWLSIISSAPGQQGYASGLEAEKIAADANARPSAILLDPEGRIGRLYDARTTPHMFVIDAQGTVAYMGAIDDKPTANQADVKVARNYVSEALAAVAAGQPVKSPVTRPYGCSVKYGEARS